ncbi:MAG TPA: DNA-3-methyladenine glycosylase [Candidatus Polarisedimenticolia bacterium]|nr:DNA-3-methyladenine glycosylase [Candidatus Polarisedimenticolia bacterium]
MHVDSTLRADPGRGRKREPLPRDFYGRSALVVARELLGARLVRIRDGARLSGFITETEAYLGEEDLGCHAKAGRTVRTAILYGPPGYAYVYFTYGMHWLLNAVTGPIDFPAAVLIRAIHPAEGIERMTSRRVGRGFDGPAKLTQAMEIDGAENGLDLTRRSSCLWIEKGISVHGRRVTTGPRVGLDRVPEPWKSKPWRFLARLA